MSLPTPATPLDACLNLHDFERVAEETLKPKSWAYYASAADDLRTKDLNTSIYSQVRFRPRVLVDVQQADASTTILGYKSRYPFFIAPAAMGKLANKDGELCLVKGAGRTGIHYGISTHASVSHKDLAGAKLPDQTLFFQLYVNRDRSKSEKALVEAAKLGYRAVIVTVDTPFPGNRELDLRTGLDANAIALSNPGAKVGEKQSAIAQTSQAIDASLSWTDLAWIRRVSGLPIIVKGVQTVEDALLCVEYGVEGMMLSNHGGRQVDGTLTPLETLLEIRRFAPHIINERKIEIYLDSGIRRGTDIVMALCLGATAVSLGRPFMYSLVYGEEGVTRVAEILGEEVERAMRLVGARSVKELTPKLVNTIQVERKLFGGGSRL
ncbi:putative L-lactate dehydrogenase [Leucosporidium creatinivorum]|uniref:L-lactate dehydrogenase (cytochrome) n=1 Tax=Leucosporidium creatinivorum TaxID=106004 RepID=A0A1Y2FYR2_9BASI|nr:putative L-lactate dehydrogenase [Leucosporidium creatinivorum]